MVHQVLMVAEKPSLARSLAEIISHKECRRRKSMCSACDVYEFEGSFPQAGGGAHCFKMTSVCGHVMSLDFLPKYNKWDEIDPVELFEAETMKKESIPSLHMSSFLQSEGRGMDYLVLWLDCDLEGENICFEVMDEVLPVMRQHHGTQTVFRAKFSSITEPAIMQAFRTLTSPNHNESRSVDARQELDLRIGCSFTRFQTRCFQAQYSGLNNSVISYGPCQTPTLGFCVQRHDEIQRFTSEKFWKLALKVKRQHAVVALDWGREGIFDNEVVHLFLSLLQGVKEGRIVGVAEKSRSKAPPPALHTVELLRMASSRLHMGPKQTMDVAERLYIEGFISYPRTETTRYPNDFDFRSILSSLQRHNEFGEYASAILQLPIQPSSSGKDVGDHPPITPMRAAARDQLRDADWKVYDFVTRHFLATLMPECKYKLVEMDFDLGGEEFHWSGSTPVSPGYTAVYTWHAVAGTEAPVQFEKDQVWNVEQLKVSEHMTSPPGYLSESELITLMEKHGIGTDASISTHIENICSRNYVKVDSGRCLLPTKLGVVLVHGYQKIDPQLVQPTMRSAVEEQLVLIAKGKADYDKVLRHTLDVFRAKFQYFSANISAMDELFEASFSSIADSGRPLSRCGLCRRYMKFIAARPQRLHCANCNQTYSLPQGGSIKLYKELKCPLDEFELLLFAANGGRKSYLVCPYCYNEPPFKGKHKGMGCNMCPHQSCPHAMPLHSVDKCAECEYGIMVLEPRLQTGGPSPKWQISCNNAKCKVAVSGFDGSPEVLCTKEHCECGATLLSVDMTRVTRAPSEVAGLKHVGCWRCDSVLSELLEVTQWKRAHHKGRGRGRGRRH